MINNTNLYLFFSVAAIIGFFFFVFNLKSYKSELSNKILLKNLLEGLDLDLPEELKSLESSSTDPQKLS